MAGRARQASLMQNRVSVRHSPIARNLEEAGAASDLPDATPAPTNLAAILAARKFAAKARKNVAESQNAQRRLAQCMSKRL